MYDYDDAHVAGESSYNKKPEKKSTGKKILATIGIGLLFGVMASFAFQGSNYLIEKVTGKGKTAKAIEQEKEEPKKEVKKVEETKKPEESKKSDPDKAFFTPDVMNDNPDGRMSVEEVAKMAMPSVVAITNKSVQEVRSFYGMGINEYEAVSAGSGIIIGQNDTELLIATNAHVVEGANTLSISFIDEEVYNAEIKGSDKGADIAIVAVNLSDIKGSTLDEIKVAAIGSSNELVIGEDVVAIGNALGYGQSVTSGIVSALNRTIDGAKEGSVYIQTDAAINPGNSGGALLNMKGEVVGINSAKLANTKIEGMGYAIPIDLANPILEDMMNLVTRSLVDEKEAGYLGISGFSVTPEVANAYGIPEGVYVSEADEGQAADRAGIKKGDVIVRFDGISMDSINKLKDRLGYYKAGETVDVVIARADEGEYKEKTIKVTLDGREGTPLDPSNVDEQQEENNEPAAEESENETEPKDQGNGQRNGEFNFGGNHFEYSIPGNLFDIFGR